MNKYTFLDKEEQKQALKEFLDSQGAWENEYRTSNSDSVDEWLYYFVTEAKLSLQQIKDNNGSFSDLVELIEEYEGKLSENDFRKLLAEHATMEACGIHREDNQLFQQPVGEVESQVSGMGGEVNGVQVNCMLTALLDGLTLDEQKTVARNLDEAYWSPDGVCPDCIYVNCDYDCWAAVVDVDAARKELQKRIPKEYIRVVQVPINKKRNVQGIHLIDPDKAKIEDAIETAERDSFKVIYVHRTKAKTERVIKKVEIA